MKLKILIGICILLIILIVFLQNIGKIEFRFFFWNFLLSKFLVLLFFFFSGILTGLLFAFFFVRAGKKDK